MKLAVIPARGGSKRIPRKNIKLFHGKPLIAWSIETAIQSNLFDEIIVSTDDEEIAAISEQYGADVPFIRDPNLSDDYTGTSAVIVDAIRWYIKERKEPEIICCIYATAPFITIADLQEGFSRLEAGNADFCFPVSEFPSPIQRALRISDTQEISMFNPQDFEKRSQDLEKAYYDAGQFYWGTRDAWLHKPQIFNAKAIPVVLPGFRVQDIDTIDDWHRAEFLFEILKKENKDEQRQA